MVLVVVLLVVVVGLLRHALTQPHHLHDVGRHQRRGTSRRLQRAAKVMRSADSDASESRSVADLNGDEDRLKNSIKEL